MYSYDASTADWNAIGSWIAGYIACIAIFGIIIFALMIVAYWKILNKAGYNGAWSLLVLIPGLGSLASIGILLFLAFSEWPALRRPAAGAVYVPPPAPYPTTPPPAAPGYYPPPPPMAQAPAPSPIAVPPAAPPVEPPAPAVVEAPTMPMEPPAETPAPPAEPPAPPAPPAEPSA